MRSAMALQKTAVAKFPDIEISHIDMVDYVTAPMKHALIDSYEIMIKRLPELWGFLYDKINQPKNSKRFHTLTKSLKRMNCKALFAFVREYRPDHIIATHCLPAELIKDCPDQEVARIPVSIVVTDYDAHVLWEVPNMEYYFVASEKIRWKFSHHGIPNKRIVLSGIPIGPEFSEAEIRSC